MLNNWQSRYSINYEYITASENIKRWDVDRDFFLFAHNIYLF